MMEDKKQEKLLLSKGHKYYKDFYITFNITYSNYLTNLLDASNSLIIKGLRDGFGIEI